MNNINDFIIIENESVGITEDHGNDDTSVNSLISIVQFLNELKLIVDGYILIKDERISPYYLPDFRTNLLRICKRLSFYGRI